MKPLKAKMKIAGRSIKRPFKSSPGSFAKRISCASIIALLFWVGGLGCVACCVSALKAESCHINDTLSVRSDELKFESASPCTENSCCEIPEPDKPSPSTEEIYEPASAKQCCLLAARVVVPAALPQHAPPLVVAAEPVAPSVGLDFVAQPAPMAYDRMPMNRGSTYLKICVLLI